MSGTIRVATADDAQAVKDIYDPIVRDTAISFEYQPPSVDDVRRRITRTLERYPWLVLERDRNVLGYVYGGRHSERDAYDWSVEVSVYIHASARRGGVGRALYSSLFALLELQGFYRGFAGVTLPNAASVGLHESMGFEPVGVYRDVGYKDGQWHDCRLVAACVPAREGRTRTSRRLLDAA